MNTKADWKAWNDERISFLELDSQGFESGIASLERHISKLQAVAPKDTAGWMNSNALEALNRLKADLTKAKVWAGMM